MTFLILQKQNMTKRKPKRYDLSYRIKLLGVKETALLQDNVIYLFCNRVVFQEEFNLLKFATC